VLLVLLFAVVAWQPFITQASGGGSAGFAPAYNKYGTTYIFYVSAGPPNTCGTLDLYRNGVHQVTPGWLCTDASGNATKGPWTATSDETVDHVFIQWPDGSTTNQTFHVSDATKPTIRSTQRGGSPPSAYSGTATDAQWGAGFNFTPGVQSSFIKATYQNTGTSKYWDGTCYCSTTVAYFNIYPSSWTQYSATWAASSIPTSPPGYSYKWCVSINDIAPYTADADCITF
jgi:hypothetical protein